MKPRSGASAMEWFTFLRGLLGWDRPSILQVNVPDLDVSLRVDKPFGDVESSQDLVKAAEGDQEALAKTVHEEHAAAENLVARCMEMLEKSSDWGEVVAEWALPTEHGRELSATPAVSRVVTAHQGDAEDRPVTASSTAVSTRSTMSQMNGHRPVGLAWKRYDRLEWVHGANEKSMYGSIGMEKFHDLELRPKQHYPTSTRSHDGEQLTEPPPVEGFLVRLTSQKGAEQKMGKLFYKRLYFSTHSQYLVFNRPGQADPPPPPSMPLKEGTSEVPGAHEIAEKVPLIFAVNPFPLQDSQISWLNVDDEVRSEDEVREHDENAFDEDERKINLLLKCDGLINLTQVTSVRNIRRGATPADRNVEDGPEVDFHDQEEDDDTRHEDGTTNQLDDERTFEVVLKNGLVIRLQASGPYTTRYLSLANNSYRPSTNSPAANGKSASALSSNTGPSAAPPTSPSSNPCAAKTLTCSRSTKSKKPTWGNSPTNGKSVKPSHHHSCTICAALAAVAQSCFRDSCSESRACMLASVVSTSYWRMDI